MSNNAQTPMTMNQQGAPGWFTSLDYVLQSAGRVAEGVIGFKLANTEAKARAQEVQWRAAGYNQLYGSQVGSNGAPWGGLGSGAIPGAGTMQAGMGGALLPIGIGLALAFVLFKD